MTTTTNPLDLQFKANGKLYTLRDMTPMEASYFAPIIEARWDDQLSKHMGLTNAACEHDVDLSEEIDKCGEHLDHLEDLATALGLLSTCDAVAH